MKIQHVVIALMVATCATVTTSLAQTSQPEKSQKSVKVTFKNNSILPRHYTFVLYWPKGRDGNATEGVMMAPFGTKTVTEVAGAELYLADRKAVDVVMSGKKIQGKPFFVFKPEDNGKTIELRTSGE